MEEWSVVGTFLCIWGGGRVLCIAAYSAGVLFFSVLLLEIDDCYRYPVLLFFSGCTLLSSDCAVSRSCVCWGVVSLHYDSCSISNGGSTRWIRRADG